VKTVGVDIIETERIAHSIARFGGRFLERVYTDRELTYCNGRVGSLAARWAAKEAVSKALGTGIGDICWQDIEVINDDLQRPTIQLHNAAADLATKLGITSLAISLSHTKKYAVAFVVTA
jgi:holo-[acyl-carrier protein] synthase